MRTQRGIDVRKLVVILHCSDAGARHAPRADISSRVRGNDRRAACGPPKRITITITSIAYIAVCYQCCERMASLGPACAVTGSYCGADMSQNPFFEDDGDDDGEW